MQANKPTAQIGVAPSARFVWFPMKYAEALAAILLLSCLFGQDIAGDWQGTLLFGKVESRLAVTIAKGAKGNWTASEVAPDDGSNPRLVCLANEQTIFIGIVHANLALGHIFGISDG
jgi:hypothetical protein